MHSFVEFLITLTSVPGASRCLELHYPEHERVYSDVAECQRKLGPVVPHVLWSLEDLCVIGWKLQNCYLPSQYCHFDFCISNKTHNMVKYVQKMLL